MSAGKRYKFARSEIQFSLGFDDTSMSGSITAITNADPPVATDAGHTLGATGTVTAIRTGEVSSGMIEAGDRVFLVQVLSASTFAILNEDGTAWGTFSGTLEYFQADMSDWCEVTAFNRQGGSAKEIDATTVCSEFEEIELDIPSGGSVQVDFNYAPLTTVQQALEEFDASKDICVLHYSLPRSGGERWVTGFVQQTGEQGSRGNLWTGSLTFRVTGKPVTVTPA